MSPRLVALLAAAAIGPIASGCGGSAALDPPCIIDGGPVEYVLSESQALPAATDLDAAPGWSLALACANGDTLLDGSCSLDPSGQAEVEVTSKSIGAGTFGCTMPGAAADVTLTVTVTCLAR